MNCGEISTVINGDQFLLEVSRGWKAFPQTKGEIESTLPETNIFASENGWLED